MSPKRSLGFMLGALSAPLSTLAAPQWGTPVHTNAPLSHFEFKAMDYLNNQMTDISINVDPSTWSAEENIAGENPGMLRRYKSTSYVATATRRVGDLTLHLGTYKTGALYLTIADNFFSVISPPPIDFVSIGFSSQEYGADGHETFGANFGMYTENLNTIQGLGLDQARKLTQPSAFGFYGPYQPFGNYEDNTIIQPLGTPVPAPGVAAAGLVAGSLALGRRRRVAALNVQATGPELI